jgi:uncharacterized protein (TIGR02266 family)
MHNARFAERTPFLGQVDIVPHTGDRALREWAQDVSETGMFVRTRQPFAVGDSVSLRFDHADDEVHIRAAEVIWVRRSDHVGDGSAPGIGVRFVSVDAAARAALRRLAVRSRPPRDRRSVVEHTGDMLAAPAGPPLSGLGSGVPRLSKISLPPDDPTLSSESRVFDGIPAAPRAVTFGPAAADEVRRRAAASTQPTTAPTSAPTSATTAAPTRAAASSTQATTRPITPPTTRAPTAAPTTASIRPAAAPVDDDPFAGWTFRRDDGASGGDADDDAADGANAAAHGNASDIPTAVAAAAMGLNLRFDDDAPGSMLIENPSILESTTVPPAPVTLPPRRDDDPLEGFALGALPPATHRAFDDGVIAVRHLPVATVRRTTERAARRPGGLSLRTAAAFLVAGCCAGALVGLLQRPPDDDALPARPREAAARLPPIALPPATTAPATTAPATTAPATTAPATTAPATTAPATTATTTATPATPAATDTTMPATPSPPTWAAVGTDDDGEPPAATAAATTTTTRAAVDAAAADTAAPAGGAVVATAAPTTAATTTAATTTAATTTAATTTAATTTAEGTTTATAGKPKKKDGSRVRRGPVTAAPGRVEVALPRAGRVQRAFALASPARVVVDLKGSDVPEGPLVVDGGGTREVRFGRPARKVDRVVVVLDGEQKPGDPHARVVGNRVVVTWRL